MTESAVLIDLVREAQKARDVPKPVYDKAVTCLVDFLSCALEAADLPWSRQSFALAAGKPGRSPVVGEAGRYFSEDAAFANAVRGHGLVREDMHTGSIAHMGVVIWPVLTALATENPSIKADPFAAAVAGYEIGGRIGRALMTPEMARLFRPTGMVGPLSGTLAGALLLGLDEAQTINALALAINTIGGLNEWPHSGADDMYFHPGFASRNSLTALRLAKLGTIGSASAIDGVAGLFAAFGRQPLPYRPTLYPDGDYEIMSVFNKEVPACNFAQSPCQVALAAARRIEPGDAVKSMHLSTYQAAINYPGCDYRGPFETPLQAKMSIYFGMAATMVRGEIAEANYSLLDNPDIAAMIKRTEVSVSDALDAKYPAKQGAVLVVETVNGKRIEESLEDVRAATPELIRDRYAAAARASLGEERTVRAQSVIEALYNGQHGVDRMADLVTLSSQIDGETV